MDVIVLAGAICKGRRTDLAISDHIQQPHDIGASREILQDLDLALYLLLLDRLEHLDDAFLIVGDVYAFEDFGVFPSTFQSSRQYIAIGVGLVSALFGFP